MKDEIKTSRAKAFFKGVFKTPEEIEYDQDEREKAGDTQTSTYTDEYERYTKTDTKPKTDYSGSYYDFDDYSSSTKPSSSTTSASYTFGKSDTYKTSGTFGTKTETASHNIYKMDDKPKFRLSILRLDKLEDAVKVADGILTGNTITLIDLRSVPRDIVRRIIDFIDGVRYTCGAKMEIVADYTYVVVPKDVELTGDLLSQIDTSNLV